VRATQAQRARQLEAWRGVSNLLGRLWPDGRVHLFGRCVRGGVLERLCACGVQGACTSPRRRSARASHHTRAARCCACGAAVTCRSAANELDVGASNDLDVCLELAEVGDSQEERSECWQGGACGGGGGGFTRCPHASARAAGDGRTCT
jgi:hypothetical protein